MSLDFYGIFWAWLNVNQHWEFFRSASATGAFLHNFTLVVLSICLFVCLFSEIAMMSVINYTICTDSTHCFKRNVRVMLAEEGGQ